MEDLQNGRLTVYEVDVSFPDVSGMEHLDMLLTRSELATADPHIYVSRSMNMSIVSVRAVFDRGEIRLLEKPPVQGRYDVLVTFLSPEPEAETVGNPRTFRDLKGIWSGIDLSLEDIQASEYKLPEDLL